MGFFSRSSGRKAANSAEGTERQPSKPSNATSSTIDEHAIQSAVEKVLTHEAPVVFGTVSKDLQQPLLDLEKAGDCAVPHIRSSILSCASGRAGGPYWWDGAIQLCKVLSGLGTPTACDALLDLVEQDSRIVEFDQVRAQAAACVGASGDSGLVPRLVAASELPNAPLTAIKKAIEALGGETLESPGVLIEEGRLMEPADAVRFFQSHQHQVSTWPKENQGGFYYFYACKVEKLQGTDAAKPYYAAGLLANPDPNAAGWLTFGSVSKTRDSAMELVQRHPLPEGGPNS